MHLNRVISIAWKGLVKNKFRSLLTMLGVIIGVAAVIIMISVSGAPRPPSPNVSPAWART